VTARADKTERTVSSPGGLGLAAMRTLSHIAERGVKVHCLTNTVAEPITANTLLAVGAVPSLTGDPDELRDFLGSADALMINLGTPDPDRQAARRLAAQLAGELGLPWVLDPVMAERAAARRAEAVALLAQKPAAVRCNGAEAAALTQELLRHDGVVAVTGASDRVTYRDRRALLGGGDAMTAKVTAGGCALSALLAAFLAADRDAPFRAALCALAVYNAAAFRAGARAAGPGSFAVGLLDALSDLTAERIAEAVESFELEQEGAV
jgi:hydroxyethylthiazole kinase